MQNYFGTFYVGKFKPQNSTCAQFEITINIKHIFAHSNCVDLFRSQNKGHMNIEGFTVSHLYVVQ